jgi:hypothetical protein
MKLRTFLSVFASDVTDRLTQARLAGSAEQHVEVDDEHQDPVQDVPRISVHECHARSAPRPFRGGPIQPARELAEDAAVFPDVTRQNELIYASATQHLPGDP